MSSHTIKTVQQIPATLTQVWNFFSDPANLQRITPSSMGFEVISKHHGQKVYPGQIIEYKVKPLLGISLYWMTEITQVMDKEYFLDQQRFGPYRFWHHQHHFKQIEGGVEMTDIVHYKIRFGILGEIINTMIVRKKLKEVFEYRIQMVEEIFGKMGSGKINVEF